MADVSFTRKKSPVQVTLPRDGRSYHAVKTVTACAAQVRASIASVSLEGMPHNHARYKLAIVATYPGADAGGGPASDP
jgi:hypothetical protein